jgi:hypothetical protein
MSRSDSAALTADLLVTKGHAGPSHLAPRLGDRIALGSLYGGAPSRPARPFHTVPLKADQAGRILFRLDEARRHRLRLAAAHLGKSSQAILLAALDHYLTRVMPTLLTERCPCIEGAEQAGSDACCGRRDAL